MTKRRLGSAGLVAMLLLGCLGGCGSGLSGSSTCQEFMQADSEARQKVVAELATKYDKPDYTTPLGAPEVPFVCSQNPNLTLDQFFQRAG